MPCLTCNHALQVIAKMTFWCPRCGTLRKIGVDAVVLRPKLIERLRSYERQFGLGDRDIWYTAGIAESINLPDDRPVSGETAG
jgi:hypothetical protein